MQVIDLLSLFEPLSKLGVGVLQHADMLPLLCLGLFKSSVFAIAEEQLPCHSALSDDSDYQIYLSGVMPRKGYRIMSYDIFGV